MSDTHNPAGRLLEIVRKAQLSAQKLRQNPAKAGWADVFGIPFESSSFALTPEDDLALINYLIQLKLLIKETEQALRNIADLPDRYLRPFPRIRDIVNLTELQSPFGSYITPITEGDVVVLEFCAEKLSSYHLESAVAEDELNGILEDIHALYEMVIASDIHPELKTVILDALEVIRRAVHEYRVRGVARLEEALPMLVGSYVLNKKLIEAEEGKEEVGFFRRVLGRYSSLVATASHTTKLIEAAATYIPPLLPGG
jgi:hypothetical protein